MSRIPPSLRLRPRIGTLSPGCRSPKTSIAACQMPARSDINHSAFPLRMRTTDVRPFVRLASHRNRRAYSANLPTIGFTVFTKSFQRIAIASRWVPASNTISGSDARAASTYTVWPYNGPNATDAVARRVGADQQYGLHAVINGTRDRTAQGDQASRALSRNA